MINVVSDSNAISDHALLIYCELVRTENELVERDKDSSRVFEPGEYINQTHATRPRFKPIGRRIDASGDALRSIG